ncbi:hypothetical protein HUK80_13295 [Flavobacterium sp. MAH-1]|uniref:T9SS sorting signal type C domain-containing protein n=1 Tax=Flavobacterium agri TaxID=2743471 RepID=A0A7Y9C7Z7_9FLAO|nr:hypothetical protein [Flavobacterium agri]NUY81873.1 hypothetical protein [Flavobacterium agri]NYA71897.1 hypothetical protein [Flavobacterium agri]
MKQKLRFNLAEIRSIATLLVLIALLCTTSGNAQLTLGTSPYTQDFNTGSLQTGWTVRTGATATALGSVATPITTSTGTATTLSWGDSAASFRFAASAKAPLTAASSTASQQSSTDRSLSVRTTAALGDPGASFNLQLANTTGKANFSMTFSAQLQSVQGRTTTYAVQYGLGSAPASYTTITTFTDLGINGGAWGTQQVTANFNNALDNQSGTVWIRIVTLAAATGSGSRCTFGIDDVSLTFGATQPTPTTTSISPSSAAAGDPGFTITVNGTNFVSGLSTVTWNGSARTTTFGSATQLTATINASDIASIGSANVGVTTTGAAAASNTQTFTINAPATPSLGVSGTTAHGASCPTVAATPIQYTITNTGLATANGISVVSDNPEFVVSGLSATTIAGSGGTATYFVTFTPASAGAKTATVTVSSSTSGSNSPTSSLTGTGTTPVAAVVTSSAATAINNTIATLNGNLGTLGVCPATTEKGFVYSQTSVNADPLNAGTGVTKTSVSGLSTGNFNLPLSSLPTATSYSYKAYVFDGTNYTYGTVQTFSTLAAANHLALVSVPAAGNVGVALSTFTVEARRPDNSLDTNYTGSVTISKASGPGGLGGTLTISATSGVASFSTATFDSAGTYTITAASGSLTSITSGNIVVTLAPITVAAWNFFGQSSPTTFAATTFDTHLDATSNLNLVTRGPGAAVSSGGNSFRTVGFQNDGISTSNTDYFQTTLKTNAGYSLSLSSLTAVYVGTTTFFNSPGVTSQYAYSLDGTNFTLIGSPVQTTSLTPPAIDLTGVAALQQVAPGTTVYIRYYASGQTNTGGWGFSSPTSANGLAFSGNVLCMQPTAFNVTGGGSTCNPAGLPVGLSNSQTNVNYQLKRDGNNVGSAVAGTGAALSFGNQTVAGTYTVEATNNLGGCNTTVAMSGNAVLTFTTATTWTGTVDSDWSNAGNWSCGVVPTASSDVLISSGSPQITANSFANTLTIQSGALLTVLSGRDLTVTGAITTTGGNFTIENNANLIQVNNVANAGLAKVKRNSSALMRQDYTLWASPVSGQNLLPFSPQTLTNRFYTYNTDTNQYNTVADPNTTGFAAGTGYLIRMPNNHPTTPTVWAGEFNGTLRNGDVPVTLTNSGAGLRFNLIGNPYASPISMQTFVTDNASNITGTLYFWRKTNNAASPSYCTWSSALGFVSNGEAQVVDPQGIIRTGQGFLVEASAAGTQVTFNNAQRSGDNANQFFRSANEVEVHRVWLNATNASGAFSQTLVGYVTDATLADDAQIDGKFFNDGDIAFYSLIGTDKFAIQGRPLPFVNTDVVPMGFKAANAGTYSIAIDHVDGLFSDGQNVYLRDNSTNIVHDLNSGVYSFAAEAGTFNDRFEVIYQNALGVNNPGLSDNAVIVYKQDGQFVINSGNVTMSGIKVYDALGKLIKEVNNVNASETRISTVDAHQMLIFKIQDTDGHEAVKKVMN